MAAGSGGDGSEGSERRRGAEGGKAPIPNCVGNPGWQGTGKQVLTSQRE